MADLRTTCEAVVEAVKYGDALYPLSRPVLAEMAQAWLTLTAGLPEVQDDDAAVILTQSEIQFVMQELRPDHDGSDFEPACPSCTAYKKLEAAAMKEHPPT